MQIFALTLAAHNARGKQIQMSVAVGHWIAGVRDISDYFLKNHSRPKNTRSNRNMRKHRGTVYTLNLFGSFTKSNIDVRRSSRCTDLKISVFFRSTYVRYPIAHNTDQKYSLSTLRPLWCSKKHLSRPEHINRKFDRFESV